MSYYGSARARTYHADPGCRRLRVAKVVALTDLRRKVPCELCVPGASTCMACFDRCVPELSFDACSHSLCADCAPMRVRNLAQARTAQITCPCPRHTPAQTVSKSTFETYVEYLPAVPSGREATCPMKRLNEALNLSCPHCGAVYFDFDACISLQCQTCNGFFCALCQEKCKSTDAGHAHVLNCPLNPNRGHSYFITQDEWERFVKARRLDVARRFLGDASAMDAMLVLTTTGEPHEILPALPWRRMVCFWALLVKTLGRSAWKVLSTTIVRGLERVSVQHHF